MKELSRNNQWKLDKFWKYLKENPDIKIVKFNLTSTQMRSLFDKDVHDYWDTSIITALSIMIQQYIDNINEHDRRDEFINHTHPGLWSWHSDRDLYLIYQLFKIAWLKHDIRKNGIQAPVQILKTVESYHCHPGSDKKYALTILDQLDEIPCFYIHYPDLDPSPFFLNHPHEYIDTPEQFADIFEMAEAPSFDFEWGKVAITRESDIIGDHPKYKSMDHFYSFSFNVADIWRKREMRTKIPFVDHHYQFLSYHDSIHREQMNQQKELVNEIYLKDDNTFVLYDTVFDLVKYGKKRLWIPQAFNNWPTSLIDDKWQHNDKTALKFKLDYLGKKGDS